MSYYRIGADPKTPTLRQAAVPLAGIGAIVVMIAYILPNFGKRR